MSVLVLRKFLFSLFIIIACLQAHDSNAINNNLSLELQNTNLSDAIRLLAKFLAINVIISPAVQGTVTLHLRDANPMQAFHMLLVSHGLAKWQVGNLLFIAPREELIKRHQEEIKWQEVRDASLPLVTQIWQIYYGKAEDIAHLLQDEKTSLLSKRGRVRIDNRTNSICIQDVMERLQRIYRLVRLLDVPVKQILIEARLASVDSDFERELGIRFTVKNATTDKGPGLGAFQAEVGHYSIAVATLPDGSLLDVKLAALEKAGHAELISTPSLFTANQQLASIEAGEEIPYQEVSESGGTAVTFKKAVLGLKVTPQVLPGNKVLLQLQINQDRPSNKLILGVPTISTRQMSTSVLVKNKQTIVLGGIYEMNTENGEQRLPFLSQLPLLGWAFKQQNKRHNKRELLIFVTPKIMTEGHDILD